MKYLMIALLLVGCEQRPVASHPAVGGECDELTHTTHGKTCYLLRCQNYRLSTLFCEEAAP